MKKIYFLAASLLLSAGLVAQTNLGFETWTAGSPDGWETENDLAPLVNGAGGTITSGGTPITAMVTQGTTGAAEGSSYAILTSFTLTGLAAYQIPDGIYSANVDQKIQTTERFTAVKFSYRANLVGGDQAVAFFTSRGPGHDWGANAIGQGMFDITASQSAWTEVTMPITYFSTDAIDSVEILFATTKSQVFGSGTAPTADSTVLEIDKVELISPTNSVKVLTMDKISAFPNPAKDVLNVYCEEGVTSVSILSLDGKLISTTEGNKVDVSGLTAGIYFYSATTSTGSTALNKFVKQ